MYVVVRSTIISSDRDCRKQSEPDSSGRFRRRTTRFSSTSMSRCSECEGSVVWNEDAASNICTSCGTLTDPSQCVLTNSHDPLDSQYFNPSAPNTLKRLRGGSSWNIAGQSKEVRLKNNIVRPINLSIYLQLRFSHIVYNARTNQILIIDSVCARSISSCLHFV